MMPPPVLRAPAVCVTSGLVAAAVAAGPAKDGGGGGGTMTLFLRLAPGLTRDFRENSGSLPTTRVMGGLHRCPSPGSGHRRFSWGEEDHNRPLPAWLQPAPRGISEGPPQMAATGNTGGRGVGPREGHVEMPERAPAHQGGSRAPVMAHGRASRDVT